MHCARHPAWDYTGAALAGGRWNPIGVPMLYTAEHLSLACLEVLVHLDKGQLPRDYVWSAAELANATEVLTRSIPPSVVACQEAGRGRLTGANQLAVRAPSAVVPEEFNVLLNPNHDGYEALSGASHGRSASIRGCSRPNPGCCRWKA
jgi:RES domain-containing protein